ncbi:MAG TPA: inorganic diphosphatase [Limnochordia bacterium]
MVEIPRGSRNKYEYDPETGRIYLDRMLFSSVHYPTDYGFIPDTLAEDGDALDALVLVGEATFPGCYIRARPVAMFEMEDEAGPDAKVICVPVKDPQWNWVTSLDDIPENLRREIAHFFQVYKALENKPTRIGGWLGADEAWAAIRASAARFRAQKQPSR